MKNINGKAAFSGMVTASVTHELQNVLAIIKENAGLMEDILHMNQKDMSGSGDRLQKCIESIKKQTYRGVGLTSGLNQFAHTADHALMQINLYDTVKKLVFLTQRLITKRGVELLLLDSDQSPSITTDPLLFYNLLFLCINYIAEESCPKTVIQVSIPISSIHPAGIQFECNTQDVGSDSSARQISLSPKWIEITKICDQINATADIITEPFGIFLTCS